MYKSFAYVSAATDLSEQDLKGLQLQDLLCAFFIIVIVNYTLLVPAQTSTMCTRVSSHVISMSVIYLVGPLISCVCCRYSVW